MLPEREAMRPPYTNKCSVLEAAPKRGNTLQATSNPSKFAYSSIVLTVLVFQLIIEI